MSKMEVKRQILASQISVKRTLKNEQGLERELSKFFKRLQKEVISALHEYWSEYQLLQGQINLMVAPVHEAHKEYYEILEKYVRREYKLGVAEAKRNVERLRKKNRVAFKAAQPMPINGFIRKGDPGNMNDWFATIPKAEKDLLNRTFRASEQTMSRVDNQINKIITDGYRGGKGINDIGAQLNKRFDQLSSWESRRIARTEVNTSHNAATVDTYRDMGVEYTQWIAAHDDRTRDSHAEVDGEIIPMGGKYSNGLEYPGDMSGPVEEWINCRCSNAPFVVPFGYMAPSFTPFRESDLIPIIEDAKEPTPEQLQENLSTEQKALYNKYQKDIQESKGVVDGLFSTANERLQAQHTIETTTIKLNQLKNIATGEIGRGYATFIKQGIGAKDTTKPDELDKFALTTQEQAKVQELQNADKLGLIGKSKLRNLLKKQEFNELHNKKITNRLSETETARYNELYNELTNKDLIEPIKSMEAAAEQNMPKVFEDPNFFKLSEKEAVRREELMQKTRDKTITREEKIERRELGMRERIQDLHEKLITKGLDVPQTQRYLEEYSKLKQKGMKLPEIPLNLKFAIESPTWEMFSHTNAKIGKKYDLTEAQSKQLYELEKKKLLSEHDLIKNKITERELSIIEELQNQRHFNHLYYVRESEGGLNYESSVKFKELYRKLENKLKLDKNLITQDHVLPKYDHKIKPGKIDENTNVLKLKGKSEDGLPPGHDIKDLFTIDVTKATINEQRVVTRWMGNDFVYFRDFVVRSKGDINAYIDYVLHASEEQLKHYGYIKTMIEEGKTKEVKSQIKDIAKSIEHDLPVLDNILNNNMTKKAMTLWRKETRHHLGKNPKVGDVVILPGKNSTAITLEGAEHFSEVSHREFPWTYEIEAPVGTRGAYVSHLSKAEKIRMEMEYLLADDTQLTIVKFEPKKNYAKLRVITY